jgi:hypothetical protein
MGKTGIRQGGNLIEYEDGDPIIKKIFESELKKSSVKNRMRSSQGESSD